VVLLEQDFALGGAGIRGSIHFYWYGSTGGAQLQVDRAVSELYPSFGAKSVGFHPDAKRTVINQVMFRERVDILFGAMVYETLREGDRIQGVLAATEEGPLRVHAGIVIDASGDGDVAAAAGVPYQMGRERDGIVHVYSMVPRVVLHDQRVDSINFDSGWVDPTDPWDISNALMEGRKQIYDIAGQGEWKLHNQVKPFDHLIGISPQIGIRESRRVLGAYQLSFDDWVMNRSFDDRIMRCMSHYDNHGIDVGNETLISQIWKLVLRLDMQKMACDIPYRSILASEVKGLLLAGRCISLDRDAAIGIRMQRDMQKLGEAAGVAAAQAIRYGQLPHEIDIRLLQARLVERGVLRAGEHPAGASYPNLQFEKGELAGVSLNADIAVRNMARIADYLGSEDKAEQGRALWWIMQIGAPAKEALLQIWHNADSPADARQAALQAMALIRMKEAEQPLREMLASRQDPADWKLAAVLLRYLGCKDAWLEAVERLISFQYASKDAPLLLQYLGEIAGQLADTDKERVIAKVHEWLASPQIGEAYVMPRGHRTVHFRWSLEIGAGSLLYALGDRTAAIDIWRECAKSDRVYIRNAAVKALDQMENSPIRMELDS